MSRFEGPLYQAKKQRIELVTKPGSGIRFRRFLLSNKKDEREYINALEFMSACWLSNQRPYCNVHGSLMNTVTSRSLSKVRLCDYMIPASCNLSGGIPTICFRFDKDARFPVRWAVVGHVGRLSEDFNCPAWVLMYMEMNRNIMKMDHISYIPRDESYPGSDIENDVIGSAGKFSSMSNDGSLISDHSMLPSYFLIMQTYAAFRLGSDLIVDEVPLAVDVEKYERTKNKSLIEKARRRGVIGWDLGKHVETGPHMRRPHFGIRWKGVGHSRPELVPVRGCIVNGKKLKMPEGYEPVHE